MSAVRVLVVDDEPGFVRLLDDVLTAEGWTVTVARDGIQALSMARELLPDIILLDWNLPGKDGLEVCKTLKDHSPTRDIPIILLTIRRRETDTVVGLEIGADDYICKRSLRPRELVARVRAALRKRGDTQAPRDIERAGTLEMNTASRTVTRDGQPLDLRLKEFDLLRVFLEKRGRVLTRAFLTETVWGTAWFGSSRTVDTTVAHLRAKLGPEGDRIESCKGVGYKFRGS